MGTAPQIRIFKAGTFQDIHGTTHAFAPADLDEIVASYDAQRDPAPLVIGHPQHDNPAYGWVGRLTRDGDTLVAEPSDVAPNFAEAVRDRRFRKVSASFYPPAHPGNPTPGRWSLKHVGFLGAAAPAVKGLGTVSFSEADEIGAFTLPFEETSMTDTSTLEEREAAFAEREAAFAAQQADLDAKASALTEREATMIAAEQLARHAEHVAFAEAQVAAGRLAPAGKDQVAVLLGILDAADAVSFGEAAGEQRPADVFRAMFANAAPVVSFAEIAPREQTITDEAVETPDQIAARAVSFAESERAAGREVTPQAAVRHVLKSPPAA